MGVCPEVYMNRIPYLTLPKRYNSLAADYKRILSSPLLPNNMKTFDITIYGKRRSGKSTTEDRIAHDIKRWHPNDDVQIIVSKDFNALCEHAGEWGDVFVLIYEDPLEQAISRGGTTVAQKEAGLNYQVLAHHVEKKLKARYPPHKSDRWRSGVIYTVTGSQEIKGLDKTFRCPDIMIFKSTLGTDNDYLRATVGNSYFNKLDEIIRRSILYDEHYLKANNVIVIGGTHKGYLILEQSPKEYHRTHYVHLRKDSKLQSQKSFTHRINKYVEEILTSPDFDQSTKSLQARVYAFLWEKHQADTPDLGEFFTKKKGLMTITRLLTNEFYSPKKSTPTTPPPSAPFTTPISTDTSIYKAILTAIHEDTAFWSDPTKQSYAMRIIAKYMNAWSSGLTPTQSDIAEQLTPPVSQDTISSHLGATGDHSQTLRNYLCGVHGGRLFEYFYSQQQQSLNPSLKIYTEPANYHWPDYIDSTGRIASLKFSFFMAVDSTGKTRRINIDEECKPEIKACKDGFHRFSVNNKHIPGFPEQIPVNETFDLPFINIAWGPTIIVAKDIDPLIHSAVAFKYPNTYILIER